jgi:hypothetical protein
LSSAGLVFEPSCPDTVGYSRIGDRWSAVTADWHVLVFTLVVAEITLALGFMAAI